MNPRVFSRTSVFSFVATPLGDMAAADQPPCQFRLRSAERMILLGV